jgi:hypothetical protein|tara:strand:- start:762 stop:1337 length:576 start_codon:yes stop_codon:yes gene_type:complete
MKDLNISQFPNITRVGQIIEGTKLIKSKKYVLYNTRLNLVWDDNLNKDLRTQMLSIVYVFTINGVVVKIGRTDGKSGIMAGMNFYLGAGTDDPGINRFIINKFMRNVISEGDILEVYMTYETPTPQKRNTLFGERMLTTHKSSIQTEESSLQEYFEVTGKYPEWNYQEAGRKYPISLCEEYRNYDAKRKNK